MTEHQERNFARTDAFIRQARALLTALEAADDARPPLEDPDHFAEAVPELIRMLGEKFIAIAGARHSEWVGLVDTPDLTAAPETEGA